MPLILENIAFAYGSEPLLEDVSLQLQPGEIVALLGASGSGKSTLFKLITGLLRPQAGRIKCSVPLSYMMQENLLLPWRTTLGNVLLSAELSNSPTTEALALLDQLQLSSAAHQFPHELSGGMRVRVALARALLPKRPLLLLDEPFGSLDVLLREQLYDLLSQIRAAQKTSIVLITHDFHDALHLADRILVLANGRMIPVHNLTDIRRLLRGQEPARAL